MSQVAENIYVVFLGMGTVFVGLICIVLLCMLMSAIVRKLEGVEAGAKASAEAAATPSTAAAPIADRQAIIAASCALIAEELGKDVENIKVVSFRKM